MILLHILECVLVGAVAPLDQLHKKYTVKDAMFFKMKMKIRAKFFYHVIMMKDPTLHKYSEFLTMEIIVVIITFAKKNNSLKIGHCLETGKCFSNYVKWGVISEIIL